MKTISVFYHLLRQAALKKTALLLSLLLAFSISTKAVVKTQDLESSYKGYSIEKIPGTDEFVAAGTFYVDGLLQPFTGYHFLHLDINGNVLLSNYVYPFTSGSPQADWELRVVDITVEDSDNFWIVMSARDLANNYDFAFAEKVQISNGGNPSLILPNQVTISNQGDPMFENLYPTHSVFEDGYLYICGYVSGLAPSTPAPTVTSMYKQGMVSSTDVSTPTPTTIMKVWETIPASLTNPIDYDMALKMQKDGDNLYVTGAGNVAPTTAGANSPSGALFIHFSAPLLNVIGDPTVSYFNSGVVYPTPTPNGIFGMDVMIRNGEIFLLVNEFEYYNLSRWGVVRLDPGTHLPDPVLPSYVYRTSTNTDWVKQFMLNPSAPDANHVSVVGEIVREYNNCMTPPMYNPPSFTGVVPYIVDCDFHWNPGTGIGMTLYSQYLHAANIPNSTTSNTLDYLASTPTAAGTMLENVTRHHTFAIRYEDQNSNEGIALIYPKQRPTNPDHLNAKFMTLDAAGQEPVCANEWSCQVDYLTKQMQGIVFAETPAQPTAPSIRQLRRRVINVFPDSCQNGSYKTTSAANIASAATNISLYPNPATTTVNVDFGNKLEGDYTFKLMDITGKVVYEQNGVVGKVAVQLPQLSAGTYLATISTADVIHSEQLVIQ